MEIHDKRSITAAQLAEEEAEKERKRKQNALPYWHKSSTIGGVAKAPATTGESGEEKQDTSADYEDLSGVATATQQQQKAPTSVVSGSASASIMTGEEVDEEEDADIMGYYENYYNTYASTAEDVKSSELDEATVSAAVTVSAKRKAEEEGEGDQGEDSAAKKIKSIREELLDELGEDEDDEDEEFIEVSM